MKFTFKKIVAFFLASLSLMCGISIYSFFREPPYILSKVYHFLKLQESVQNIHTSLSGNKLSDWILYGLPDLLWMFSFMLFILLIWNFKINRQSVTWIIATIAIGFAYEFLQLTDYLPGVFDVKDLGYILTGVLIALLFTIKVNKYAKMD